jgi:hypothetical protein
MSSTARHEGETQEERALRRAEKQRVVQAHRAKILQQKSAEARLERLHRREDVVTAVRFENTLPELPIEARFLALPLDDDAVTALDVL